MTQVKPLCSFCRMEPALTSIPASQVVGQSSAKDMMICGDCISKVFGLAEPGEYVESREFSESLGDKPQVCHFCREAKTKTSVVQSGEDELVICGVCTLKALGLEENVVACLLQVDETVEVPAIGPDESMTGKFRLGLLTRISNLASRLERTQRELAAAEAELAALSSR